MLNSIMVFTFSILEQKYSFWVNLNQKIKIVCLRWNWVSTLSTELEGICLNVLFLTKNNCFGQIWIGENENCLFLSWNLVHK